MRLLLLLSIAAACASPKPLTPVPRHLLPVAPPASAPAAPAAPDEGSIKARSHQLFDAYDRADVATLEDLTGPTFGLYEQQRFKDRAMLFGQLKERAERHGPIHSRTWSDERALVSPDAAVFIGDAAEHVPADGSAAAIDDEGSNMVVWVHAGDRWVAAAWEWSPAGIEAERARWNSWLHRPRGSTTSRTRPSSRRSRVANRAPRSTSPWARAATRSSSRRRAGRSRASISPMRASRWRARRPRTRR